MSVNIVRLLKPSFFHCGNKTISSQVKKHKLHILVTMFTAVLKTYMHTFKKTILPCR